jgi:hypothetical protein
MAEGGKPGGKPGCPEAASINAMIEFYQRKFDQLRD